jgi:hypothetical protein
LPFIGKKKKVGAAQNPATQRLTSDFARVMPFGSIYRGFFDFQD